jgi:hypothetical protein
MLHYLKWLSIAGVWFPIATLAAWATLSWIVGALVPEEGFGLVAVGMFLTFALSHALAISSLVGLGLLITRRASSPALTLLSAVVGAMVSVSVLLRVYFDLTP